MTYPTIESLQAEVSRLEADRDFWMGEATRERPPFMKWWIRCNVAAAIGWIFLAGAMMYPEPREIAVRFVGSATLLLSAVSLVAAEARFQILRRKPLPA